jgi:polyferredoxin
MGEKGMASRAQGFWLRALQYRGWVQLTSTVLLNSWFTQRLTKGFPCLALNCYACPLAVTACPVGSIQHFAALRQFPLYVMGVLGLAGALVGRVPCAWFCPFGWFQELMHRLPVPKWRLQPRRRAPWWLIGIATLLYGAAGWALAPLAVAQGWLFALFLVAGLFLYGLLGVSRWFAVLGLTVLLPLWLIEPWFCKLCPAGILEGGIPQVIVDVSLRTLVGPLFWLKIVLLVGFGAWMAVTRRPFCRWVCPLGAIWSPFNRWSIVQVNADQRACIRCDRCREVCPVDICIYDDPDSGACIRCMECVAECPTSCISIGGQ